MAKLTKAQQKRAIRKRRKSKPKAAPDTPLFDQKNVPVNQAKGQVVNTAEHAAELCGVSRRTFMDYMREGMDDFCTVATPGQKNGNYPIDKCREFINSRRGGGFLGPKDDPEMRRIKFELEQAKLNEKLFDIQKKTGTNLTIEKAIAFSARAHVAVKSKIYDLVSMLKSILPPEIDETLRNDYLRKAETTCDDICSQIGQEILRGIEDEQAGKK